ncbi:hypothetical protein COW36_21640 [bacterium (Candidatus Blackallbacteria) CG17_big_fil_post_rev_8_21_14_2_50_48_46]|uniref:Uncharacterized protein n=1 Tax=bacterium (Candidatus Blackallbacteria) CG17_big_fil_post_rev_8_21_14_2_50_48_46 TaxID=2014261 RepID=A0A2M7FZ40_9BACT|nr:MAG: hypothetical protein COW64_14940 [bacterium (Candidatus Blackallbacteria) CG18_big_fil_WC_8_21_14_2_50_49_26]PIW14643.1 MAG: hypothetical protein COW36_21640 [bacterium (Candidatus Blackallbacteria) CG17_big_fil_post_rev_8_21_14_2_50_48_46]PIW45694.1 MAG: hypothetical protein COW20_19470 [bacterium (Candidatus Blackallbacteria) CG13_big_fil_rev_8_21_14_2_50_49_14]
MLRIFCLCAVLGSSALVTTGQSRAALAKSQHLSRHQLNASQLRLLKALGTPVVVPGYMPAGYTLEGVYAQQTCAGVGGGPGYELRYLHIGEDTSSVIILRGATGGFGGPAGDERLLVKNPVLGPVGLEYFKPGGASMPELKQGYYLSDWVGKGPLYFSIITTGNLSDEFAPPARAELIKVLQALVYLP